MVFYHLFTSGHIIYSKHAHIQYLHSDSELWCLLEIIFRLSVEVKRAVGQGGGRDCTLLYSLRLLPERLQAAAPGCCHFALATWIHRQTDPWLTLQVELSKHSLQYCTVFSCLLRSGKSAQLSSNQTCA